MQLEGILPNALSNKQANTHAPVQKKWGKRVTNGYRVRLRELDILGKGEVQAREPEVV